MQHPKNTENNCIKIIRSYRRLTQIDAALNAGIERSQWAHYESGKNAPSVYTGIKMARALGVSVEELFAKPTAEARRKYGHNVRRTI